MSEQNQYEALLEESARLAYFMMGLASQSRRPPQGVNSEAWRTRRLREIREHVNVVLDQCPIVMEAVTRKAVLKLVEDGRATLDGDTVILTQAPGNLN
jgi:hypothetical protein